MPQKVAAGVWVWRPGTRFPWCQLPCLPSPGACHRSVWLAHVSRVGGAAIFARCSGREPWLGSRVLAEDPEYLDHSRGHVTEASPVDPWHPLASRTDQKEVKEPTLTSLQCCLHVDYLPASWERAARRLHLLCKSPCLTPRSFVWKLTV